MLLDGNVLVALADANHVHHARAEHWLARLPGTFATCPITQGTLVRVLLQTRAVASLGDAVRLLALIETDPRHRFLVDDLSYSRVQWRGVLGHRQVTDAYLAALARHHGTRLATLDQGLAALHPDVAVLVEA